MPELAAPQSALRHSRTRRGRAEALALPARCGTAASRRGHVSAVCKQHWLMHGPCTSTLRSLPPCSHSAASHHMHTPAHTPLPHPVHPLHFHRRWRPHDSCLATAVLQPSWNAGTRRDAAPPCIPAVTRHPLGACCRPLATQGDADGLRCPLCTLPPMLLRAQHAQHIALMPGTPSTQRVASW